LRAGTPDLFRSMDSLPTTNAAERGGPLCGIFKSEIFPKMRGVIFRKVLIILDILLFSYIFPNHPIFAFSERSVFQLTLYFNLPTVPTRTAKVSSHGASL
jgi:hypothetical protein